MADKNLLLEGAFGFEIINRDKMREQPDQSSREWGLRDKGRTVRGLTNFRSNLLEMFRRASGD
jgi:hypothetical protein